MFLCNHSFWPTPPTRVKQTQPTGFVFPITLYYCLCLRPCCFLTFPILLICSAACCVCGERTCSVRCCLHLPTSYLNMKLCEFTCIISIAFKYSLEIVLVFYMTFLRICILLIYFQTISELLVQTGETLPLVQNVTTCQ